MDPALLNPTVGCAGYANFTNRKRHEANQRFTPAAWRGGLSPADAKQKSAICCHLSIRPGETQCGGCFEALAHSFNPEPATTVVQLRLLLAPLHLN
jgi:hypothetical protein